MSQDYIFGSKRCYNCEKDTLHRIYEDAGFRMCTICGQQLQLLFDEIIDHWEETDRQIQDAKRI